MNCSDWHAFLLACAVLHAAILSHTTCVLAECYASPDGGVLMQAGAAQPADAFTSVMEGVPVTGELLGILLPSAIYNQDTQVIAQTHPEVNMPDKT